MPFVHGGAVLLWTSGAVLHHPRPVDPAKTERVPPDGAATSGADAEHVATLVALRPEVAPLVGTAAHGRALPDPDPAARAAVVDALVAWRKALEQRTDDADAERRLDARVFAASVELFRFAEQKLALHEKDPDVAGPVFQLLLEQHRRGASTEDGAAALAARLAAVPAYLSGARGAVKQPDALLLERAREVCQGGAALAKQILDDAKARAAAGSLPASLAEDLQTGARKAAAALDEQKRWLDALAPVAAPPIGRDALDEIMRLRGLDLTSAEVLDLGKSIAEELRIEERRLGRRAFKGRSAAEALAAARSTAPVSQPECMAWLQELVDQSRPFLQETGAVPLMEGDDGVVVETPPHGLFVDGDKARLLPLRAGAAAGARRSLLLVDDPRDRGFGELSVADLEALAAREAYPGRHLMAATATKSCTPARRGAPTGFLAGVASTWGEDMNAGWTLYACELMRELQFRDSPASKLVAVREELGDALLAVVDVCLGIGRFGPDEAVDFLVRRGGFARGAARARVRAMRRTPTAAVSGLVGKVRIEQLRREARKRWRQAYSDKRFHGLLLRSGPIPLAYLFEMLDHAQVYAADGKTEDITVGGQHP